MSLESKNSTRHPKLTLFCEALALFMVSMTFDGIKNDVHASVGNVLSPKMSCMDIMKNSIRGNIEFTADQIEELNDILQKEGISGKSVRFSYYPNNPDYPSNPDDPKKGVLIMNAGGVVHHIIVENDDLKVDELLKLIKSVSEDIKVYGSFPKSPEPHNN